jgi:hypothetical protein
VTDEKLKIATVLAESPVASLTFEVAAEQYLFLMEDDGEVAAKDMALSVRIQEILCRRFGESVDIFFRLIEKLGAHKVVKLFWPSFAAEIGDPSPLRVTPDIIVEYLAKHLRACPECRELARRRLASHRHDPVLLRGVLNLHDTNR